MKAAIKRPSTPGTFHVAKAPVWLTQTPGAIRHRAPVLGEHTEEILTELGYDRATIAKLREMRIV